MALLADACAELNARCLPLEEDGVEGARSASVMIGALRQGQRRISQHVAEAADRFPNVPLLLFSEEPLIRPAVTLQRGRVTVVSGSTAPRALAARIRPFLKKHASWSGGLGGPGACEELSFGCYTAGFAGGRLTGDDAVPHAHHASDGATLVLAPAGADPAAIDRILVSTESDSIKATAIETALGGRGAVIRLGEGGKSWALHWPRADWPLWLFSRLRLPNTTRLEPGRAGRTGGGLFRMEARSGDVLVGMTTWPDGDSAGDLSLLDALADGAATFLDRLERTPPTGDAAVSALLIEVR